MKNNGYILIEAVIALLITSIVSSAGIMLLTHSTKNWSRSENSFDISYNCRHAVNKLYDEIRDSCGAEILDFSEKGWIKLYKSIDKKDFITFRMKNNKLFIGYNNMLNSNTEFTNYVEEFRIKYIPENVENFDDVVGIRVYLKFNKNAKELDANLNAAFRY